MRKSGGGNKSNDMAQKWTVLLTYHTALGAHQVTKLLCRTGNAAKWGKKSTVHSAGSIASECVEFVSATLAISSDHCQRNFCPPLKGKAMETIAISLWKIIFEYVRMNGHFLIILTIVDNFILTQRPVHFTFTLNSIIFEVLILGARPIQYHV